MYIPEKSGNVEGDGGVRKVGGEKASEKGEEARGNEGRGERGMFKKIPQRCRQLLHTLSRHTYREKGGNLSD